MKISLNFIYKNNAATIVRMLDSCLPLGVGEVVAVDTGSEDGTDDLILNWCHEHGVALRPLDYIDAHPTLDEADKEAIEHLSGQEWPHMDIWPRMPWITNFREPRQMALDASTGDFIIWLDTDDELVGGDELRAYLEAYGPDDGEYGKRIDSVRVRYDYEFARPHAMPGEHLCKVRQYRVRVVRRGHARWTPGYPIHETISFVKPGVSNEVEEVFSLPFWVHHTGNEHKTDSALRNLVSLYFWEKDGNEADDRLLRNWADSLLSHGRIELAAAKFAECLSTPGDRLIHYHAQIRLGDCCRLLGRLEAAKDHYARAERMQFNNSGPYIAMAQILKQEGNYAAAMAWAVKAAMCDGDQDAATFNPTASKVEPLIIQAECLTKLNRFEESLACWQEVARLTEAGDSDPWLKGKIDGLTKAVELKSVYDALMHVWDHLEDEPEKRNALLALAPKEIAHFPVIAHLQRPPRPEGKRVIAIFCGSITNQAWGPKGNLQGVGGSEDAVIHMSRQLVALGWHVEVYGDPPLSEIGTDEHGVVWLPHTSFNEDPVDVFISWRQPQAMSLAAHAKYRVLWLQDIPDPLWYPEENAGSVDAIFCISKLQASHLPEWCQEKVVITGNAIDPGEVVTGVERDPHRYIYCSCPTRGLEQVLEAWPSIRKADPKAVLDIYYGFRPIYDQMARDRKDLQALRERVQARVADLADQGVVWHGMVAVPVLHEAMARASFLLYPTSFNESYCTTADKIMAHGCLPVTSRWQGSSLPEVIPARYDLGIVTAKEAPVAKNRDAFDAWLEAALEAPQSDHSALRAEMAAWVTKEHTWTIRAAQWDQVLQKGLTSPSSETPSLPERAASTT